MSRAEVLVSCAEVVADPDGRDHLEQVPAHVLEVHQLRHQPAHGLRPGFGGQQLALRAGVVEYVGGHRVPFGVVAVQQPDRCPIIDLGGQFPAEVEGVLDSEVEALSPERWVDVRGVAGQERSPDPVALGLTGGVVEAGEPAW